MFFNRTGHNFSDGTMGIDWGSIASNVSGAIGAAGGGSGINWTNVINQGFGIGSQAISAFSGQNSGTQIGYNPASQSVFAITPSNQLSPGGYAPYPASAGSQGFGPSGGVAEDAFGSLTGFVSRNPLIIAAGALGVYLLMKEPPRRR